MHFYGVVYVEEEFEGLLHELQSSDFMRDEFPTSQIFYMMIFWKPVLHDYMIIYRK